MWCEPETFGLSPTVTKDCLSCRRLPPTASDETDETDDETVSGSDSVSDSETDSDSDETDETD